MLRSSNLECANASLLTLLELDSKMDLDNLRDIDLDSLRDIDLDSLRGIDLSLSLRYLNRQYSGIDNDAQFQ